jgi:arylsulfotransferase ASST
MSGHRRGAATSRAAGTVDGGLGPHGPTVPPGVLGRRHSRRDFLLLAGGAVAGAALAACGGSGSSSSSGSSGSSAKTTATFHSEPDLKPPLIDVTTGTGSPASGFVCLTPSGPLLVDSAGNPVWIHPVPQAAANLRVQTYRGQPVLTWWQGEIAAYGVGTSGEYVILDTSYRRLMTVQAKKGLPADLHEFIINGEGVAYFTAYRSYMTDLTSVGGPSQGQALDATIQAVDLATGKLVFDWSSAAHIGFSESYQKYAQDAPYDPVHLNSIDFTPDGKLLVSARNTWTIYKIDPTTGAIIWRLGGKKGDFTLDEGTRFAWQHDARTQADGTISLFDDEADPAEAPQSRGLVLNVDETTRTASVKTQYVHPGRALLAGSQGSFQHLPNGDVLLGWGAEPYFTELQADGTMVLDGKLLSGTSYRAFRFDWTGNPSGRPAVATTRSTTGRVTAYASWNGSTETDSWELLAGSKPGTLQQVSAVPRNGFETAMPVPAGMRHVAVAALDPSGAVLAQSATVSV